MAPADIAGNDADDDVLGETRLIAPRPPRRKVVVVWDDGSEQTVSGTAVFGRNPEAVAGAARFAIADATRSLSKTHFVLTIEPDALTITDRDSTNGLAVGDDDAPEVLVPGEATPLAIGTRVTIGERSFVVEERT